MCISCVHCAWGCVGVLHCSLVDLHNMPAAGYRISIFRNGIISTGGLYPLRIPISEYTDLHYMRQVVGISSYIAIPDHADCPVIFYCKRKIFYLYPLNQLIS